jgi:hypothetical protein
MLVSGQRTKMGDLCVSVEIAFRFNLEGLQIKAAWWYADPEQIASLRAAAAAEESGGRCMVSCHLGPRWITITAAWRMRCAAGRGYLCAQDGSCPGW